MTDWVRVRIASDVDMITARQKGRELAAELQFTRTEATLMATAISEVARNILSYAEEGEIELLVEHAGERRGVVVIARDQGPGITDIDQAMASGYSSSGGFGLGLPGARRLMDEFRIVSEPGEGTTVIMKKWSSSRG